MNKVHNNISTLSVLADKDLNIDIGLKKICAYINNGNLPKLVGKYRIIAKIQFCASLNTKMSKTTPFH